MLNFIPLEKFQKSVGSTYYLELDDTAVEMILHDVRIASIDSIYESFSLLFSGPLEVFLPQQLYSFQHPELGVVELFIVPVEKKEDQYEYEAVFNRLIEQN
ncbi:hypothetical protein [Ammoniphilus sp. CFH 90114]|uniref:DUF6916 family protein n=1 Tax=Ammoniphilus sp. CFH 90114 TaxID=2493665 RepID=UPI00100F18FA|nr:hypothetical protein [Ammoniphilus sp. CFH 90114]RXT04272.1 hypothetical protein EIZ39_20535 [Ammoniphilus sp. CFH 90114]